MLHVLGTAVKPSSLTVSPFLLLLLLLLLQPCSRGHQDTSNEAGAVVKNTGEAAQDILRKLGHEYQNDVNGLRGSSGSLSWFFIEELKISTIKVGRSTLSCFILPSSDCPASCCLFPITARVATRVRLTPCRCSSALQINTTVSVSSSLVNSTNKLVNFGTFGKYLGAAGFSLVNVSNVPLELGFLDIKSELLSVNSLVGRAIRHYVREGLSEAHKVRSGTARQPLCLSLEPHWAVPLPKKS